MKRAKPIEEWLLSFQKHARKKTYTAKQRWRFYQRLFAVIFLPRIGAYNIIVIMIIIIIVIFLDF